MGTAPNCLFVKAQKNNMSKVIIMLRACITDVRFLKNAIKWMLINNEHLNAILLSYTCNFKKILTLSVYFSPRNVVCPMYKDQLWLWHRNFSQLYTGARLILCFIEVILQGIKQKRSAAKTFVHLNQVLALEPFDFQVLLYFFVRHPTKFTNLKIW